MSRVLLMLSDERLGPEVRGLMEQPPLVFSLHHASCTSDALMITSGHAFALAIVDLSLCCPLELEFVRHLTRVSRTRFVFAVREGSTDIGMPSDPTVRYVAPRDLLEDVRAWTVRELAAQPSRGGQDVGS